MSGDTETPTDQRTFLESLWGICWGFKYLLRRCLPWRTRGQWVAKIAYLAARHIWSSFWACANHHLDTKGSIEESTWSSQRWTFVYRGLGASIRSSSCNHPTTTGLYRLGYCTPFMKLSYHAEVLGTYFRGWYSAAPADLLVIVGPSSMASILGTRIPGHFIMPLANQGNYIWDMDGYGWIWWNFWWRLLRWLWRIGING